MNVSVAKPALSKPSDGASVPVLAFLGDLETLDLACRVIPGARRGVEVREGGLRDAIAHVQSGPVPTLLIVDISDTAQPAADMAHLKALCAGSSTIVALGTDNDVALYRSLVTAGATDYLVMPVSAQELRRAILSVSPADHEPHESRDGRLICLVGARGGVGTSSLAVGMAWKLAQDFGKQVAILDLDLHFGTTALSFDVDPGKGLRDALRDPERIDSLLVASALVNVSDSLYVLGSEEPLDEPVHIGGEAISRLIEELRSEVDHIVIDLPRHHLAESLDLLGRCDGVGLVTDLSLPSLRDAVRIRRVMDSHLGLENFRVIANRVGHAKASELSVKDFEQSLGAKLDFQFSELPQAAKAAMDGKPLAMGFKVKGSAEAFLDMVRALSQLEDASVLKKKRNLFGLKF